MTDARSIEAQENVQHRKVDPEIKLKGISTSNLTLRSVHVTQVRVVRLETVEHVSRLFEVVNVLKRPEHK